MKLTKQKLKKLGACDPGYQQYLEQKTDDFFEICRRLKNANKLDWLNWLLPRMMNKKECVQYAIYAAEKVIKIYESKYTNDKRPRKAIIAAKNYLKNPCKKTKAAADSAAYSAAYAADAAYSAAYAADSAYAAAADSAYAAAAYAADSAYAAAADSAYAAAAYAADAAAAADSAADSAYAAAAYNNKKENMLLIICNYGIKLLKRRNK